MKVLNLDRTYLRLIGVVESKSDCRTIFSQYACIISVLSLLIPMIAFFLVNFRDVKEATSAFYLICITSNILLIYFEYVLKRSIIFSIIQRLQRIADSADLKFKQHYRNCEQLTTQIVHYHKIFVFTSVFSVISLPMVVLIHDWWTGQFTQDSFLLPAPLLLPFDLHQWPGFVTAYIICYFAGYFISLTGSLYPLVLSIAMYLKTAFDEIRFKLASINQIAPGNFHAEVHYRLDRIIKLHREILEIFNELGFMMNRIKYYMLAFGSLTLCTGLFQIQQNALDGNQMFFQCVAACSCTTVTLFMFCFGGEIIISANDISNDLYQLCWYKYDSTGKHIVRLMILRTQKPFRFADFSGLNLCLATFANIIRRAYTVFAMLKGV